MDRDACVLPTPPLWHLYWDYSHCSQFPEDFITGTWRTAPAPRSWKSHLPSSCLPPAHQAGGSQSGLDWAWGTPEVLEPRPLPPPWGGAPVRQPPREKPSGWAPRPSQTRQAGLGSHWGGSQDWAVLVSPGKPGPKGRGGGGKGMEGGSTLPPEVAVETRGAPGHRPQEQREDPPGSSHTGNRLL